jgi:hypothetical protein
MQREAVEAFEELLGNTERNHDGSKQDEESQSTSQRP